MDLQISSDFIGKEVMINGKWNFNNPRAIHHHLVFYRESATYTNQWP